MQDNKILLRILIQITILAREFKTKYSNKLPLWKSRIYHWTKHVKKCLDTKFLANRRHVFHRGVKQRRVHKADVRAIEASFKFVFIIGKAVPKVFKQVRRSAG